MRFLSASIIGFIVLAPATCFALKYCVDGNEPISAANYEDWPGLVGVVNDPTRERMCWCNGDEWMWYRGDTDSLNRVLAAFAAAELEDHQVIIVPGPGSQESDGDDVLRFDWTLHMVAGIAEARIVQHDLGAVVDVHPTLTIYVTDRIDLDAVVVPEGITLATQSDLRQRFEAALQSEDEQVQSIARERLDQLDAATADLQTVDAAEYERIVSSISDFVSELRD